MRRVYILPNLITTFGLACGLFVIFRMAMLDAGAASYPVVRACALLLLVAATADVLDGAIARLMRAESEFGGIFDSLADAITFGVAPAVIMIKSLDLAGHQQLIVLASTAAMLYAICAVLRLARYSSGKKSPSSSQMRGWERMAQYRIFVGLPVPASAAAAVSATLLMIAPKVEAVIPFSEQARAWISILVMVVLGYFMISRWKFPGIKVLHIKVQSYHLIFLTVVLTILFFYGILFYFPLVFFGISWGYLAIAWALSITRLVSGKRLKALEDFAPAPDTMEFEEEESDAIHSGE